MQTPYELFKENFVKSIHSNIFLEPVVKIYPLQTGGGKSHYQDTEMPVDLKEAFPELKYIIRLSPTREVSDDGTFKKVKQLGKFRYLSDPGSEVLDVTEDNEDVVYCISITHNYFLFGNSLLLYILRVLFKIVSTSSYFWL